MKTIKRMTKRMNSMSKGYVEIKCKLDPLLVEVMNRKIDYTIEYNGYIPDEDDCCPECGREYDYYD